MLANLGKDSKDWNQRRSWRQLIRCNRSQESQESYDLLRPRRWHQQLLFVVKVETQIHTFALGLVGTDRSRLTCRCRLLIRSIKHMDLSPDDRTETAAVYFSPTAVAFVVRLLLHLDEERGRFDSFRIVFGLSFFAAYASHARRDMLPVCRQSHTNSFAAGAVKSMLRGRPPTYNMSTL